MHFLTPTPTLSQKEGYSEGNSCYARCHALSLETVSTPCPYWMSVLQTSWVCKDPSQAGDGADRKLNM